jgi:3-hydroxyisobutyrate dehydrogenase-like beta-hydroxyacid dehydrogenase
MILDTSTILPVAAKQLSVQADMSKMTFCDTPMSGGTPGAESG